MMKSLNYDSSLYAAQNSMQRGLSNNNVNSEMPKKTMSNMVHKAPLNNRLASPSQDRRAIRSPSTNAIYSNSTRMHTSPRPIERENNMTSQNGGAYKNFDTFNTNSRQFPSSKPLKQGRSAQNSNDSGSEIEGYIFFKVIFISAIANVLNFRQF